MEKFAENWKISQKCGVSRQILNKIGVQLCENLYCCLKDILLSIHFFFCFMKKNIVWFLKETQTLKAYETESNKYCNTILKSNTKISKTHRLLNKILLLCLSALLSVYCGLLFLRLPGSSFSIP